MEMVPLEKGTRSVSGTLVAATSRLEGESPSPALVAFWASWPAASARTRARVTEETRPITRSPSTALLSPLFGDLLQ